MEMINGRFNFILKIIFWITRQPINWVIDNPDSPPQRQGGGPKGPSLFSKDDETCFLGEGLTRSPLRFTAHGVRSLSRNGK